jgi:hypothetical protein
LGDDRQRRLLAGRRWPLGQARSQQVFECLTCDLHLAFLADGEILAGPAVVSLMVLSRYRETQSIEGQNE